MRAQQCVALREILARRHAPRGGARRIDPTGVSSLHSKKEKKKYMYLIRQRLQQMNRRDGCVQCVHPQQPHPHPSYSP